MLTHYLLVIGSGKKTRGGITSVITAHSQTQCWKEMNGYWIQTHIDREWYYKIGYFFSALWNFILRVPASKIIHIHLSGPVSLLRKTFFFLIAFILKKKIVVHLHAFSVESSLDSKLSGLYGLLFKHADAVVVLSEKWQLEVEKRFDDIRTEVIYNPAPSILSSNSNNRQKYILYAGTLNKRKGFSDLIRAFALIHQENPHWRLKFAGNGEIKQARELCRSLNLLGKVDFEGWISGNEKDTLFFNAGLFCLPSYAEGFPMAVIDAFAYGIPVVTTPVGGLPDLLIDGKNACMFGPGDINEMANKLEDCIQSPGLRKSLVREQDKLIENYFSLGAVNDKLNTLYSNI